MLCSKLKTTTAILVAAVAFASGAGLCAYQAQQSNLEPPAAARPYPDIEIQVDAEGAEAYAAQIERLLKLVRAAQAQGDLEGAVKGLRAIETLASDWKNALLNARWTAKDELHLQSTPALRLHNRLVEKEGSGPPTADARLDRLERTVERLVRSLDHVANDNRAAVNPGGSDSKPIQPPPPTVEGVVRKVYAPVKQVEISIGSDHGLVEGNELYVYRTDRPTDRPAKPPWEFEFLGRIRIMQANPDQSLARVIGTLQGKVIKEGDTVSTAALSRDRDRVSSGAAPKK
jgi:hypothetical protein